jgi:hypothetical protein
MLVYKTCCLLPILLLSWSLGSNAFSRQASFLRTNRYYNGNRLEQQPQQQQRRQAQQPHTIRFATEEKQPAEAASSPNAGPVLSGKRILPYKILMAGLKGHKVAGAYALLNKEYKRG